MNYKFLVLLFLISNLICAQSGSLSGKVVDSETGQPLEGVNVIVRNTDLGSATNEAGSYEINNIPVGIYEVGFSYIGYSNRIIPDILIKPGKTVYLNCELQWTAIEGEEVTVTSGYFNNTQNSVISAQSLTYEEVRRAPGAREDVSRMLQNLPGVNPSNDDRNDLLIRGGSPTEVQFIIDDIEIANPNHFGTMGSTGGPITMINNEFVDNIDFYSGGFTSAYGNKLSGVMDIRFREGDRNRTSGKLDLNFGGAGGYIETPIDKNGSILIGAHRSFLDLLESVLDYGGVPKYNNLQGKITYDLSSNQKLSAIFLGADDKIELKPETDIDDYRVGQMDTSDYDKTDFKSQQFVGGLNLRSFWSPSFFTLLTLSYNYTNFDIDVNTHFIEGLHTEGKDEVQNEKTLQILDHSNNNSSEQKIHLKFTGNYLLGQSTIFTSGIYTKFNSFDYNIKYVPTDTSSENKYGEKPLPYSINYNIKNEMKYGGFINLNQKFGKLILNAGARIDGFEIINTLSLSPRFNLEYKFNEDFNIHAGYGIYYQNPEMLWILSSDNNRSKLEDIKCTHYVIGTDYILLPSLKITLEGYYKKYEQYPVSADNGYEMISMANTGTDYGDNISSQALVNKGSGRAYGIEVMMQKKMADNIYGLISYSYSDIKHKALDGILRRGAFDNRNVLNILLGYRISDNYEISTKFRYAGGNPYTPYNVPASIASGHGLYDLSAINTAVYPSYQRLDLRFDHRDFFESGTLVEYISVENVFNRKNVLYHKWDSDKHTTAFKHQSSLFIVGGISYEF